MSKFSSFTFTVSTAADGLSDQLELGGFTPFAIVSSTTWTAADMTLLASYDGTNYNNMYKDDGTEYTITIAASRHIAIQSPAHFMGIRGLQLRSGTSSTAVVQAAERSIIVLARDL